MEVKAAGRQFQRVASGQAGDLKRAINGRTKVKVSTLLSPESQKAILMVQEESSRDKKVTQEKHVTPAATSAVPNRPSVDTRRNSIDDVSEAGHVGFGAMLEKMCTTRLHGDITDKNVVPRLSKKRALRSGDRLHTAMEVVEIVRYDCDDDDKYDDTDEEQEAMQRAADLISQQRCQAWLEVHFDLSEGDDASSFSSADR